MNVLITGITGMLGSHLYETKQFGNKIFTTSRKKLIKSSIHHKYFDLQNENYFELLDWAKPEVVIHFAANTNLEECEQSLDNAILINSMPIKKIIASRYVKKIIYISTDSIYGDIISSALETDVPSPINAYGKSKLLGEEFLINSGKKYCIIRCTPIGINKIYRNNNLMTWIINKIKQKEIIALYENSYFSPVSSSYLLNEIDFCLKNSIEGVFNLSGNFSMSKLEFGICLMKIFDGNKKMIEKSSYSYNGLGPLRPLNQRMDSKKYFEYTKRTPQSLNSFVQDLLQYKESF